MMHEQNLNTMGSIEAELMRYEEERRMARANGDLLDAHNISHTIHSLEQDLERQVAGPIDDRAARR